MKTDRQTDRLTLRDKDRDSAREISLDTDNKEVANNFTFSCNSGNRGLYISAHMTTIPYCVIELFHLLIKGYS